MTVLSMNAYECNEDECHCLFAVEVEVFLEINCPKCKSNNVCGVGDGEIDVSEC